MQTGNIFVISAPSGAGKSSLVKALCEKDSQIKVSISHTTRNIRPGEEDGVNYHFINKSTFEQMLDNGEFLEYAKVYDNYYGTNIKTVKQLISDGYDIILEIDWQGANQIRELLPDSIFIYIFPPSIEELEKRLRLRNTDADEIIQKRLNLAQNDMSHAKRFDYGVINDNFASALNDLYSIILVQRLKIRHILKKLNFN